MKRLWLSAALIVLLSVLSTIHVVYLNGFTHQLTNLLDQAQEHVASGDWKQAEELTRQAMERWEKHEHYLHITLHHADIDAILTSFGEALAFLQGQEHQPAEYTSVNARLLIQLNLLIEGEIPSWKNLL